MKIGFDAKRAFCNHSGLGNYSRNLIYSLCDQYRDDKYYLFTPSFDETLKKEIIDNTHKKIKIYFPITKTDRSLSSWWRRRKITSLIKNKKLDLYHGLSHELPIGLEKLKSVKKIVSIHDLIFLRYPHHYNFFDRITYNQKFKHACRIADRIVAISDQTKNDLMSYWKIPEEKISVIYQGCLPAFYNRSDAAELDRVQKKYKLPAKFILNVGSFVDRKNQLTLIRAFQKLANPHYELVLVGGGHGSYADKLTRYIQEHKMTNVHVLNNVNPVDLPSVYQMSSLFVFPSLFEGFGIPIVEALVSSIPVITSQGSCFVESAGEHSVFADPLSVDDLADKMKFVLGSFQKQEEMIQFGLEHAKRFSANKIAQDYHNLYTS